MSVIIELVNAIQKKFDAKAFDKFIYEMHFPKFKSFAPNVQVDFRFPITVLVGPNGGGKSSILHAAWGMPLKYSTSRFWFSTPVDPIEFDDKNQNRYWYAHYVKQLECCVQSRKMCGNKRHGYWEPTRPAQKEGMQTMPEKDLVNEQFMSPTGDRWTPVDRTPYYFNAKTETSAFDRFFNSTVLTGLEPRQDYFIKYSRKLKEVIDGALVSLEYYNTNRVKENYLLSEQQLDCVNKILQKQYKSARYISHNLYDKNSFSPSVIFETTARSYSECFAGSGELAVVNCVLALEKLEKYDLLLLDEPETSLHPGAQEKFLEHLLKVVNDKYIQVIISTHSPTFVQLLPATALVVLEETEQGIAPRVTPTKASAFARLGQIDQNKITILTEDSLLKAVVDRALTRLPKHLQRKAVVVPSEVGVSEMLSNQVRAHQQARSKVVMVLDGDQQGVKKIYDQDPKELSDTQMARVWQELKKLNVSVVSPKADLNNSLKSWMGWCKKNVVLLDHVCPEQILLKLISVDHPLLRNKAATNTQYKDAVKRVLHDSENDSSSEAQYHILKLKLGEIAEGSPIYKSITALAEQLEQRLSMFD
jgi:predicted ATPase